MNMFRTKIQRGGDDLIVCIPPEIVDMYNLKEGDEVIFQQEPEMNFNEI